MQISTLVGIHPKVRQKHISIHQCEIIKKFNFKTRIKIISDKELTYANIAKTLLETQINFYKKCNAYIQEFTDIKISFISITMPTHTLK